VGTVLERTFIMIKPDGVRRKLVGEIVSRIERRNLDIVEMKMLMPPRKLAEAHYAIHKGKDFYDSLVEFITSGPVVAMIVEGESAVRVIRNMIGALDPEQAASGTIRGDFTASMCSNLIHGSDSTETAATEIELWFIIGEGVRYCIA
jgi:nucleoside-diphosphate kinase